jgi:hypothetical protein
MISSNVDRLCLSYGAVYVLNMSEHHFVVCFTYHSHPEIYFMLTYEFCKKVLKFRCCVFFSPDGLRDRDRNSLTTVLMQVAVMRDNTYQLIRHIWNDVQEDWPFYSEQERQLLKRSVSHFS